MKESKREGKKASEDKISTETVLNFSVSEKADIRLDKYLAGILPDFTRSYIQRLCGDGCVSLNNSVADKKRLVKLGDNITIKLPQNKTLDAEPQNIELDIAYEDDDLIIVNKKRGMVVHPANGNFDKTLVNALLYHCENKQLSSINGVIRPGIVHRIDKDTSGLLIVAKNDFSHLSLSEQIKAHSFKREYIALVDGVLKNNAGTIDKPIGRSEKDRKKMAVGQKNSKNAVTHYEVLENFSEKYTLIKCRLETGRTHQIRVHLASIGHPVTGDAVYGAKKQPLFGGGQLLHAASIGFIHPKTREYIEFSSEIPSEFADVLAKLRKTRD